MEENEGEENDVRIIRNFERQAHMFCISQTPAVFHGVSISTSFHEKVNDIVKSYMEFERPCVYVIKKTLKIMSELKEKSLGYRLCPIPFEDYLQNYQIKLIRH